MKRFILFISATAVSFTIGTAWAQKASFLNNEGDKAKYTVMIDFNKAYISGVGVVARQEQKIVGSVFNEFGVSVLSFSYDTQKGKTKILDTIGFLNKWYIKRVLKRDINSLMNVFDSSGAVYRNEKRNITYTFSPLIEQNDTTE